MSGWSPNIVSMTVADKDRIRFYSWILCTTAINTSNTIRTQRKWGYWEEWCTWRRVVDQEQSLGGHCRRICTRRTGRFHILHGSSKMTDDLNQLRTEPWIPNQDERQVIKMSWSIVSKAAERSSKQRHDTFCDPIALMRWSWMYKRAVSVEWCLQ